MAFCHSCGTALPGGSGACPKCAAGAPVSYSSPAQGAHPGPGPGPLPYHGGTPGALPQVSPLAIILAAVSWFGGSILCSIPAVLIARSDLRKIREGQLDPSGQTQSQLAFWIAAVNLGLVLLACFAIMGIFLFAMGIAGSAARHAHRVPVATSTSPVTAGESDEQLRARVDRFVQGSPEATKALWRDVRKNLTAARTQTGGGAMPPVEGVQELAALAAAEPTVRDALFELERRAALASGRTPPVRTPAEAPTPPGPAETDDDF